MHSPRIKQLEADGSAQLQKAYDDLLALVAEQRRYLDMLTSERIEPTQQEKGKLGWFEQRASESRDTYHSHASCTARRVSAEDAVRIGDLSVLEHHG